MIFSKKIITFQSSLAIILAIVVALYGALIFELPRVDAVTSTDLLNDIQDIEEQISQSEDELETLGQQASTLENRVASLNTEIANLNDRITLTELKIIKLKQQLKETREELARQIELLEESIRELYIKGRITTLEMLASSENFSDFLSQQEYLERLKGGIEDSVAKVQELEAKIEKKKKENEELLAKLDNQQRVTSSKREQQKNLLEETKGQEFRYQLLIEDLQAQREEAEAALAAFIAQGNFVSLGPVGAGEFVGIVGNTGFSTGPHLHFEVRHPDGYVVDPKPYINGGWLWPVPETVWQINLGNDFGTPGPYASGTHPGIDTGYGGAAVVAMSGGDVIARGCSQDYLGTPAYGYMVMVDHPNGYKTLYAHMLPPDIPAYAHCNFAYYY